MNNFYEFWRSAADVSAQSETTVSRILWGMNKQFVLVLSNGSWVVYIAAAVLVSCSVYCYFRDYNRRAVVRRRREAIQRSNERIPQRRRPGAAARDHEIFRNVIKTVRKYVGKKEAKAVTKAYILRRTRSGAVYGRFTQPDNIPDMPDME